MSLFEATAHQALADGWGDYDPDIATCDCGKLLDDDELLAGACRVCLAAELTTLALEDETGVERVPVGVVRRYKDEQGGDR